jgi:nucleoid-associated protein YgaU
VRGDTLSGIGKKFGVNWRDIAELNGIANPDLIHPGQVFRIPS